jgi:hypothetical protein
MTIYKDSIAVLTPQAVVDELINLEENVSVLAGGNP